MPISCPSGAGRAEKTSILGGGGDSQKNRFLQRANVSVNSTTYSGNRYSCFDLQAPRQDVSCSGRSDFGGHGGPGGCGRGLRCPPGYTLERTTIFHSSPKARLNVFGFSTNGTDSGYQKPYVCIKLSRPNVSADPVAASQGGGASGGGLTFSPTVQIPVTPTFGVPSRAPTAQYAPAPSYGAPAYGPAPQQGVLSTPVLGLPVWGWGVGLAAIGGLLWWGTRKPASPKSRVAS